MAGLPLSLALEQQQVEEEVVLELTQRSGVRLLYLLGTIELTRQHCIWLLF
jgi:hypothetical protein